YHPTPSPPLRWHGPQVVHSGLRTDDPIFRIDLSPPLPTHAKEARSVYSCVLGWSVFGVT
ncbi:MAG: hypothetical protein WBQ02_09510, partial [Terracidiphilus sp.]